MDPPRRSERPRGTINISKTAAPKSAAKAKRNSKPKPPMRGLNVSPGRTLRRSNLDSTPARGSRPSKRVNFAADARHAEQVVDPETPSLVVRGRVLHSPKYDDDFDEQGYDDREDNSLAHRSQLAEEELEESARDPSYSDLLEEEGLQSMLLSQNQNYDDDEADAPPNESFLLHQTQEEEEEDEDDGTDAGGGIINGLFGDAPISRPSSPQDRRRASSVPFEPVTPRARSTRRANSQRSSPVEFTTTPAIRKPLFPPQHLSLPPMANQRQTLNMGKGKQPDPRERHGARQNVPEQQAPTQRIAPRDNPNDRYRLGSRITDGDPAPRHNTASASNAQPSRGNAAGQSRSRHPATRDNPPPRNNTASASNAQPSRGNAAGQPRSHNPATRDDPPPRNNTASASNAQPSRGNAAGQSRSRNLATRDYPPLRTNTTSHARRNDSPSRPNAAASASNRTPASSPSGHRRRRNESGEEDVQAQRNPKRRKVPDANRLNIIRRNQGEPAIAPKSDDGGDDTEGFSSDAEVGPLVKRKGRGARSGPVPDKRSNLGSYTDNDHTVLSEGRKRYMLYIATVDSYPKGLNLQQAVLRAHSEAEQAHPAAFANSDVQEVTKGIRAMYMAAGNELRGQFHDTAFDVVVTAYDLLPRQTTNLHPHEELNLIRQRVKKLIVNKTWIRGDYTTSKGTVDPNFMFAHGAIRQVIQKVFFRQKPDGTTLRALSPMPEPVIAFACAALRCALDEWASGVHRSHSFSETTYRPIYIDMRAWWRVLVETSLQRSKRIARDLTKYGMMMAGVNDNQASVEDETAMIVQDIMAFGGGNDLGMRGEDDEDDEPVSDGSL